MACWAGLDGSAGGGMLARLRLAAFRPPFPVVPKGAPGIGAAGFPTPRSLAVNRSGLIVRFAGSDRPFRSRVQIKSWVNRPGKPFRKAVMAKGKKRLEIIHLVCQETGDQNYTLRRKSGGEKLKLKKYSPRLRRHTVHVEKKK